MYYHSFKSCLTTDTPWIYNVLRRRLNWKIKFFIFIALIFLIQKRFRKNKKFSVICNRNTLRIDVGKRKPFCASNNTFHVSWFAAGKKSLRWHKCKSTFSRWSRSFTDKSAMARFSSFFTVATFIHHRLWICIHGITMDVIRFLRNGAWCGKNGSISMLHLGDIFSLLALNFTEFGGRSNSQFHLITLRPRELS